MLGRRASTPRKEQREEGRKERVRGTEGKYPTPSKATDALIGDEEQNGKEEKGFEAQRGNTQPHPRQLMRS